MNLVGTCKNRGERIRDSKAAIIVSVPIDADFFTRGLHDFIAEKLNERISAHRRGVAHGVAKDRRFRPAINRGAIEALHGFGVGANRVLGDVHDRQSLRDGELDGVFRCAREMIHGPIFDEAANRAAAEKCRGFDGNPRLLRDFGDGADVIFMRARRAIRSDFQFCADNLICKCKRVAVCAGACAGEADIDRFNSERLHQMEDLKFFLDGWIEDRGILQAVAKSFVVEKNFAALRKIYG